MDAWGVARANLENGQIHLGSFKRETSDWEVEGGVSIAWHNEDDEFVGLVPWLAIIENMTGGYDVAVPNNAETGSPTHPELSGA